MIANHIHDALAQVRVLQDMILETRMFKGYSGRARMASGALALAGAAVLSMGWVPATPNAHLLGWGIVLTLALAMNYGALAYSFFHDDCFTRNPRMLKPAVDAVPPLAMGAILSVALLSADRHGLLPGTWMGLFGLANVACRHSMPRENYAVGMFYVLCGAVCLLAPGVSFLNPWPMGIVFFAGEFAGGLILIARRDRVLKAGAVDSE